MSERGIGASWLAAQICCTRTNVYKIYDKESIDTALLMRISKALKYDFFKLCSKALSAEIDEDFDLYTIYRREVPIADTSIIKPHAK